MTHSHERRTLHNRAYALHALAVLRGQHGMRWLFDVNDMAAGKPRACRWTVLTELARWRDPKAIRRLARAICQRQPATSQAAVRLLRALRLEAETERLGVPLEIEPA